MNIFLSYILLGLSLAAPIGPVNAAQIDHGIRHGFWHAWLVGLGAMAADALFMVMIYFGFAHLIHVPFIKTFLWTFGCFVLIYTGVESIKHADISFSADNDRDKKRSKSFMNGFIITLSNPLSILFWLGIYGSVLAKTAETHDALHLLLYSLGIFLGLLLWDIMMAAVASSFQKWMSKRALRLISQFSGFVLISVLAFISAGKQGSSCC